MDPGQLVRMEVLRGWSQVQKLHNRLKTIPVNSSPGGGSRAALVDETVQIIATFTNVITYLNQPVPCEALAQQAQAAQAQALAGVKECSSLSQSPLSSTPVSALEENDITTAGVTVAVPAGATVVDGASMGGSQFKVATPVTGSECSQSDDDPSPKAKKRKQTGKWTAAKQTEPQQQQQPNEVIPDDGHSWRKYGQKDILGSRHPKSYYRCTHKRDSGCPAIKYVQRSDTDPSSFHITYRGEHNCRGLRYQQSFCPQQQSVPQHHHHHHHQQQRPMNSACLRINSEGGLQITPSGPTLTPSRSLLTDGCFPPEPSLDLSSGLTSTGGSHAQQHESELEQGGQSESEVVAESLFDIGFMLTASPDNIDYFDMNFPFEQPVVSEPFCIAAD